MVIGMLSNMSFNVEKLLRDQLQQKAKQAIDNWLNKQDDSPGS